MPEYHLSMIIQGRGDDPSHRSHWAFAIHRAHSQLCTLFQVNLLSEEGLIYQFETRGGESLDSPSNEGCFLVTSFKADEYNRVTQLISREPAPRNGKDRCQDWVLGCVIALETEELVGDGTAQLIDSLVGKNVDQVGDILKDRWIKNSRGG
jgi:hypothetical protein